ncbi:MAG: type II toxin-antitoxin system HicB family antitoxin [Candidatus Acidiferrales bacterium]
MAASKPNLIRSTSDELSLIVHVWKEGPAYVAYAPELDVSSCGRTASQAKSHLREAISLFVEESARRGTLEDILLEAGFEKHGTRFKPRRILARERLRLALPAA